MEKQILSPKEMVETYISGAKDKVNTPIAKLLIKAIFAGMMIALGAAGSQVASHTMSGVGLARLVAGAVFPMGLMMVVLTGAELFTGDCLMGMAAVRKEIKWLDMVRVMAVAYIGNLIGALIVVGLVSLSGQLNYSDGMLAAYTIKTALAKSTLSFVPAFASGILCNILVCAAVIMAIASKQVSGKLLSCFFIILLFVVSGYEHCVANMFYIPMGIAAKSNPFFAELAMNSYGISAEQLSALSVTNMFVKNLLPVTLGNIVGGMFVLGIPFAFTTSKKK